MKPPKDTTGKLSYELDWEFIEGMATRMALNKSNGKYDKFSWKDKELNEQDFKDALTRHLVEINKGNYHDDGQEYGHFYALACNSFMLVNSLKFKSKIESKPKLLCEVYNNSDEYIIKNIKTTRGVTYADLVNVKTNKSTASSDLTTLLEHIKSRTYNVTNLNLFL